ncbi:MAG: hypothetical protein JWO10_1541 [Microbacteriaceae bacterium]|nr:hypothetical protein [Microbacteriaceae bacterium]
MSAAPVENRESAAAEPTSQQLDPAGAVANRVVTSVIAIGAFIFALVETVTAARELSHPIVAIFALAALGGSSAVVIIASTPSRAPFSSRALALAAVLGIASIVLSAASVMGTNTLIRNDWGGVSFGLVLLACGPYRPARQVAAIGVFGAVVIGFVIILQVHGFTADAPPMAFVIRAVTPLLALCFASVAFTRVTVRSIALWQSRAKAASALLTDEASPGIARSIQQDRVTILGRDVIPFLREMASRDQVTDDDRAQARAIANSIRSVMVAEADRSWLESVVESSASSASGPGGGGKAVVLDKRHLAGGMSTEQRTAIRTLIVALIEAAEFDAGDLRIELTEVGERSVGVIDAKLQSYDYLRRLALAPYFAIMRAVFTNVVIDFTSSALTVRFSYDK